MSSENNVVKLDIKRLVNVEAAVDQTYLRAEEEGPKPQHVNRASSMGEECERFLTYCRTNWKDAAPWDLYTLRRFAEGNLQEEAVIARLRAAGYEVRSQQLVLWWEKYKISGHLDGHLILDGESVPLEVKSMAPHFFERAVAELEAGNVRNKWLRRYLSQVTLYCLCDAKPRAALVPKNRDSGEMAAFLVPLDMEYGESLIQKAERVNAAVRDVTAAREALMDEEPFHRPRINKWSCLECRFAAICCPSPQNESITAEDGTVYSTLDIEALVLRKKEIAEVVAAAEALKNGEGEKIKYALIAAVKATPEQEIETPNWRVHGKEVKQPERIQKAYSYFGLWTAASGAVKKQKATEKRKAKGGAS